MVIDRSSDLMSVNHPVEVLNIANAESTDTHGLPFRSGTRASCEAPVLTNFTGKR
jgi:hypothetical protein